MLMTTGLREIGSRLTQEPFELRLDVLKIKVRYTRKYYLPNTD